MNNKQHKYNRIRYLEDKYSPTKIAQGEILTKETVSRIKKESYNNKKHLYVDTILGQTKNPERIKDEVHDIVDHMDFRDVCPRCTSEQLISVVVLYCQRQHNRVFKEEGTALWNRYGLTWKLYARVVANLLSKYRGGKLLSFNQN